MSDRTEDEIYEELKIWTDRLNLRTNSPMKEKQVGHYFVDKDKANTGFRICRIDDREGNYLDVSKIGYTYGPELLNFIKAYSEGLLAFKFKPEENNK